MSDDFVTRSEFNQLAARVDSYGTRLDTCETERQELRGVVATLGVKVETLDTKVETVMKDVADVKTETKLQTASLTRIEAVLVPLAKQFSGILANPRVRWAVSIGFGLVVSWLAAKAGIKLP